MSASQWRDVVSEHCRSAHVVYPSAAAPQLASGVVVFEARDLVDLLCNSRRCGSRTEAVELGDKLRARDIIRPASPGSDTRFRDDRTAWVCRAGEEATTANSFSVPALLNARHHYVLAAPFLKQGAFFLNPRVFVLDRTSRRLYVFTTETSPSPRYYIDLTRPGTTVTVVNSSGIPVSAEAMGWESGATSTWSGSGGGSKRGSMGGRQDRFASRDTDGGLGTDTSSGEEGFGDRDDRSVGSGSRSQRRNRRASSLASLGSGEGGGGSSASAASSAHPTPSRSGLHKSAASSSSFNPWTAFTSLVLGRKAEARDAGRSFVGSASSSSSGRSGSGGGTSGTGSDNYGFVLACPNPPLRLAAFSPVLRRVRVWAQALRDTITNEPLHQALSHTQVRLRNLPVSLLGLAGAEGVRSSLDVTSGSSAPGSSRPPEALPLPRAESSSLRHAEAVACGGDGSAADGGATQPRSGCRPGCQCGPGCRCSCCGVAASEGGEGAPGSSSRPVSSAYGEGEQAGSHAGAEACASSCRGGSGASDCGAASAARREDSLDDLMLSSGGVWAAPDPDAPFRISTVKAMLQLPQRAVDARLVRLGFARATEGDAEGGGDSASSGGSGEPGLDGWADLADLYTPVLQGFVRTYGGGDLSTLGALVEQPGLLSEACGVYIVAHQRYIIERAAAALFPVVCLPPPVTPVPTGNAGGPLSARPGADASFSTDDTLGMNGSFDTDGASRHTVSNELHDGGEGFFGRLETPHSASTGAAPGTGGQGSGRSILSVLRGSATRQPAASVGTAAELGSPAPQPPPSSSLPAPTPGVVVLAPPAASLTRTLSTEEALSLFEAERSLLRLSLADAFSRVSRLLDADVSEAALRRAEADMRSQIRAHMQRARSGTFSVRITAEAVAAGGGAGASLLPPLPLPASGEALVSAVTALERNAGGGAVRLSVGLVRGSAAASEEAPELPASAAQGGGENGSPAPQSAGLPTSSSQNDLAAAGSAAAGPPRPLPGSLYRGQERVTAEGAAARPRAATTGAAGGAAPKPVPGAGRPWAHMLELPQPTREAWVLNAARIYASMAAALDRAGGVLGAGTGSVSSGMAASASAPPLTNSGATRQRSMSGGEGHVYGSRAIAAKRGAFNPEAAVTALGQGAGAPAASSSSSSSPSKRPVSMFVGKGPAAALSSAGAPAGSVGNPPAAVEAPAPPAARPALLPMQPHPLPGGTEAKVLEVVTSGIKGLLVERAVRALSGCCLETGAALPLSQVHPVADLTQRVCTQIARVFGPAALAALNLSYGDTRVQLKQDVLFYTARLALLIRDWPRVWAHGFTDWGATSAYLAPSETFRAAVTAGLDPAIPAAEVTAAVATAWRAVSRLTKAVRLTERDYHEVCEEAVCKVVFSVLRGIIHGSYRQLHAVEDALLKNAYSVAWGLTTTQLSLPKELRCDAAMPTGPITPPGAFDAIMISSAVSLRVEPPLLPLPALLGAQPAAEASHAPPASPRPATFSSLTSPGEGGSKGPKPEGKVLGVLPALSAVLLPVSNSGLHGAGSPGGRPASTAILPFPNSPALLPAPSPKTNSSLAAPALPFPASPRPPSMSISRSISVGAGLELYSAAAPSAAEAPAPLRQPLPGCFPAYAAGRPEAPAAFQPLMSALQTFQLLSQVPDPPTKLRVVAATVDTLCRCITVHRQGLTAANAAVTAAAQAGDAAAAGRRPMPSLGRVDAAHLNADDLLGLLVWVIIHSAVPCLYAEIDVAHEFSSESTLIERVGFLLASLQAASMYATGWQDVIKSLKCGHCEGSSGEPITIRCKACGRLLCPTCDAAIHETGALAEAGADSCHVRVAAPVTLLPPSDRAGAEREWSLRRIKQRLIGRDSRHYGEGSASGGAAGSGAGGGGGDGGAGEGEGGMAWTGRERAWSAGSAPSAGVIRRLGPSLKSAAYPATASALTAPGGGGGRRSRFAPPPGETGAAGAFPLPLIDTGVAFGSAHTAPTTDSSLDTAGEEERTAAAAPAGLEGATGPEFGAGGRSVSGTSGRPDRLVEALRAVAGGGSGASTASGSPPAAFSLVAGFSADSMLRRGSSDSEGGGFGLRLHGDDDARGRDEEELGSALTGDSADLRDEEEEDYEEESAGNVSYGGLYLPSYPVDTSGLQAANRSLGGSMLGLTEAADSAARMGRSAPGSPGAYSAHGASSHSRRTTRSSARSFEGQRASLFGEGALDTTDDEGGGYLSEGGPSDAEGGVPYAGSIATASTGPAGDGGGSGSSSGGRIPPSLSLGSGGPPRSPQRPHTSSGLHTTPSSSSLRRTASMVRSPLVGGGLDAVAPGSPPWDRASDSLSVASSALTASGSPVFGAEGRSLSASSPAVQRSASKAALVLEGSPFVTTRITSAAVALMASPELSRYMSFDADEPLSATPSGGGGHSARTAPSSAKSDSSNAPAPASPQQRAVIVESADDGEHPRF